MNFKVQTTYTMAITRGTKQTLNPNHYR